MAAPSTNLQYLGVDKPTLPYRSNTSPTDDSPHFIPGSQNVWATVEGWLEKRPGFSASLETTLSAVPGTINRIFFWKRWANSVTNPDCFFAMVSTQISPTSTTVYALNLGSEAQRSNSSFALLFTDALTSVPFDFIAYQNFVLFGNASTQQNMRKWDGEGSTTQWGLFAPISAPDIDLVSGSLPSHLVLDAMGGTLSGVPANAETVTLNLTATDSAGTSASQVYTLNIFPAGLSWATPAGALPYGVVGSVVNIPLAAQSGTNPYAFSVYSGALPAGLALASNGVISGTPAVAGLYSFAVKVTDSATPNPSVVIRAFSMFIGSPAITIAFDGNGGSASTGAAYAQTVSATGGTAPYTYALVANGGSSPPPGLTLNSTTGSYTGNPSTAGQFIFIVRATDAAGSSTEQSFTVTFTSSTFVIDTTAISTAQVGVDYSQAFATSGGVAPLTFDVTVGGLTAQTGYNYGYTYTSVSGHESAMSELSSTTGLFTDQDVGVSVIASDDPQVTGINIYRTTDGGIQDPSVMRLLTSLTNSTQGYEDSTPDIYLGNQTGPGLYLNAPPQPLRGFITSNGRIWGFTDAASWFTGNEEITNGSPFECMSNAKNGNFYTWPSEVGGLASTNNGVDIALSEEWWQISGDTLDTFRKARLLTGGGTTSPTCVCVVGSVVYWVDTALQLWSSSQGELGLSIRPDLRPLDLDRTFLVYHKFQTRNWLMLLDAANGKLYVFDFDLNQWQIPWMVLATCLASGQIARKIVALTASFVSGHVRLLADATYVDDDETYADQIRAGLRSITPGSGTSARNATEVRAPQQFELETNTSIQMDADDNVTGYAPNIPDSFYALMDDDPIVTPLTDWTQLTDVEPLEYDALNLTRKNLAQRRWMAQQLLLGRRVAWAAVWNPAVVGWRVYGNGTAVKP